MRKQITKTIVALLLVLCMAVPSNLPAFAATDSTVTELDGAISQLCSDITEYRQETGFTYPDAPTDYADYIFAGWYIDAECKSALSEEIAGAKVTEENKAAYAKFVPKGVLSVKAQVLSGTEFGTATSKIRFVTTVDSLRYQKVGFDFDIRGTKLNSETTTVYHRIQAMGSNGTVLKHYTPDVFDSESQYFMACVVEGIKNSQFGLGIDATPYWVTLDGTKVTGESNMKSVNMSYMPMTETMSTEQKGEIVFPSSDAWDTYKGVDTNISGQGGCFDGTYYYQAIIHSADKTTENQVQFPDSEGNLSSLEYNQNLNEVIIQKFGRDDAGTWSLSKQSAVLKLRHANDITYNSKLSYTDADGVTKNGLLVISYCGNYNESKYYIGFMDRDTLELVDPSVISGIEWNAEYCTVNAEEKYVKLSTQITNIAYNQTRNQYVAGISGTHHIQVFDGNFKPLKTISVFNSTEAKSYTAQGIEADDGYIYFLFSAGSAEAYQKNMIAVYDWDGNFINLIETDIHYTQEIENIGIYKNEMYIAVCDNADVTKTLMYKITGLQNFVSDVSTGTDVFKLNKTAATDMYVETMVTVSEVKTDVSPRTGLRLTSGSQNIDFVLAYDTAGNPLNVVIVQYDSEGNEIRQSHAITSVLDTVTTSGIRLAVAKQGNVLYFYVNDVLQATKTDDAFGVDAAITASLYSKYTETKFSNYSVTTENIDIPMAQLHDTFVADEAKTAGVTNDVYFDLLNEEAESSQVTIDEQNWKGSIVNWYGVSTENFYVEAKVKIEGVSKNNTSGYAGMVLTSGTNRYYILLYGSEDGITYLKYANTGDDAWTKKKEANLSTSLMFETVNKMALDRNGNSLAIYLNDELVTTVDLSTVDYPLTGATKVGLTGWMAKATFTDYSFSARTDKSKEETVTLNDTASEELYVEATVQVAENGTAQYQRSGLCLTNSDTSEKVYFFLNYNYSTLNNIAVMYNSKLQYYNIDSAVASASTEGVKLAIAKKGDSLYFYVNDALQSVKTYDGFGASAKVTAGLYSRYTTSHFSDYFVLTDNIETETIELSDVFVADENKDNIYFDLTNEAEGTVTTNETNTTWANHSIVNWKDVSAKNFYAETTVKIEDDLTGQKNAHAGIVLTCGSNRYYVMLFGSEEGITKLLCAPNTSSSENIVTNTDVTFGTENKLAVLRKDNLLYIFLNDEVQKVVDLGELAYPITGASTVGLSGWRAKATFTDFSIKVDKDTPSLETYNPLLVQENISDYKWNTEIDEVNNQILLGVDSTSATDIQVMTISESATENVYVESVVNTAEAGTNQWPRAGLRLTNDAGENIDFVLCYSKNATPTLANVYAVRTDASNKDNTSLQVDYLSNNSALKTALQTKLTAKEDIKLAIAKQGDTVFFYIDGELQGTATYDGFGANDAVSAKFFSKSTLTKFVDYKVLEGYESDASNGTDVMALNTSAVTDVYAETMINTDSFGNVSWPRVGLRFTSTTGQNADFYVAYNNGDRSNPVYVGAEYALNGTSKGGFTNDDEATVVAPEGTKLGVAKIGDKFYVFINGVSQDSVAIDGFDDTTAVTVSLYSKNTESMFTKYGLPEMDETISLATDTFAESGATKSVLLSDTGVPEMEVQLSGATSGAHKYLYFNGKGTKVSAEAVLELLPVATSDQRVGMVLTDANKSAQLGIYLYAAKGGTAGVTALQIYSLSGFASGWGTLPTERNVSLKNIEGLENIGRENIKLSVERDDDNYSVYVNDILAYSGTLSGISDFGISATTETYIGLIAMQTGAKFSDFTYLYGDAVNAN